MIVFIGAILEIRRFCSVHISSAGCDKIVIPHFLWIQTDTLIQPFFLIFYSCIFPWFFRKLTAFICHQKQRSFIGFICKLIFFSKFFTCCFSGLLIILCNLSVFIVQSDTQWIAKRHTVSNPHQLIIVCKLYLFADTWIEQFSDCKCTADINAGKRIKQLCHVCNSLFHKGFRNFFKVLIYDKFLNRYFRWCPVFLQFSL